MGFLTGQKWFIISTGLPVIWPACTFCNNKGGDWSKLQKMPQLFGAFLEVGPRMEIINRIKLKIGGMPYTISTTEPEEYVRELAAEIDRAVEEVLERSPKLSLNDALVLCAMDYADGRRKSEQSADHIREQLTGYLEDAARARMEADELRAEVTRLRRELSAARAQNRQKSAPEKEKG